MPVSRLFGGRWVTSSAGRTGSARRWGIEPGHHAQRVVLPQPLGPSRVKNSPAAMVMSTSSTAAVSPARAKRLLTDSSVTSIMMSLLACGTGSARWGGVVEPGRGSRYERAVAGTGQKARTLRPAAGQPLFLIWPFQWLIQSVSFLPITSQLTSIGLSWSWASHSGFSAMSTAGIWK